jgi:uncharacterized membrane protein
MLSLVCKKVCQAYDYVWEKSASLTLSVLGIVGVILSCANAMAEGENGASVSVTTPSINWGTTAADLISAFTTVIVVAIGIALSIWALMKIVSLFRRAAN